MSTTQTKWIEVYIPLGVAVISAAVMWGSFSAQLADSQSRISNVETEHKQITSNVSDMRVDIASIKTSVEFIKNRVK